MRFVLLFVFLFQVFAQADMDLSYKSASLNYSIKYTNQKLELLTANEVLLLKERDCNKRLIKDFLTRVDSSAKRLSKNVFPLSARVQYNGKLYGASGAKKNEFRLLPNTLRVLKAEEAQLCKK